MDEYVSLREIINNVVRVDFKKKLQVGAYLARLLIEACAEGKVFYYIKPENVYVSLEHNSVKLANLDDYSISKNIIDCSVSENEQRYLAPELLDGIRMPNATSNVFSYAVIMYELFYHRLPEYENRSFVSAENSTGYEKIDMLLKSALCLSDDSRINRPLLIDFRECFKSYFMELSNDVDCGEDYCINLSFRYKITNKSIEYYDVVKKDISHISVIHEINKICTKNTSYVITSSCFDSMDLSYIKELQGKKLLKIERDKDGNLQATSNKNVAVLHYRSDTGKSQTLNPMKSINIVAGKSFLFFVEQNELPNDLADTKIFKYVAVL